MPHRAPAAVYASWKKRCRSYVKALLRAPTIRAVCVVFVTAYLKLVYKTNPLLPGGDDIVECYRNYNPFIITFWHGSHIMTPFLCPPGEKVLAMFSRSKDAEFNAQVAQRLGIEPVRGSGGRAGINPHQKGGARALLALIKALKKQQTVAMIADISQSSARVAGIGIITLAKMSGRPIIPCVYRFSRCWVLQKSWDKTGIPLPFGRSVCLVGEPIYVAASATDVEMEEIRGLLTKRMNLLTERAAMLLGRHDEGH